MKENKDIHPVDKLFKQSLEGLSKAPPSSVWKGIKAKATREGLSSGKWFLGSGNMFLASIAILVAASWIVYRVYQPVDSTPTTAVQKSLAQPKKQEVVEGNKKDNTQSATSTPKAGKQVEIKQPTVQKGKRNVLSQSKGGSTIKGATLSQNNKYTASSTSKSAGKVPIVAVNNSPKKPEIVSNNQTVSPNGIAEQSPSSQSNVKPESVPIQKVTDNSQTVKPLQETPAVAIEKAIESSTQPALKKPDQTSTKSDPIQKKSLSNTTSSGKWFSFMPQNLIWQMGLSGGIGNIYQKGRDANSIFGSMITAGVWNTQWKAGIETGIGFTKNKDHGVEYNNRVLSYSEIRFDTIMHIHDSIPWIEIRVDTLLRNITFFDTIRYDYSYTFLQIPLLFTKQVASYRSFCLDVKGGLILGLMNSTSVTIIRSGRNNIGTEYPGINKNYSRLKTDWQFYLSPQLRWDATKNLSLEFSPAAIFYLNNLYDKKNRPSTRPYSIMLNGGITYKFSH